MAGDTPKSPISASDERLLSSATADSVSGMFAQLVGFRRLQRRATEFPLDAQLTLEDVARDLLEPMMRDWLDKNAMPMVERLLQAELAEVLGRAGAT